MKYSPEDLTPLCRYQYEDGKLTVTVEDQGIGIPIEDQKDLFSLFHRSQNVGVVPGTGLGLAIVKRAVDTLGGTIAYESAEGLGTKFVVVLPI
jgi:signal transduction histidine kinase